MKEGIPFFSLDCTFDDNMQLLEAEFGLKGIAIIIKLYQRIYSELGYYCKWSEEVMLLFSAKACGLSSGDNIVSEVLQCALKRGIFNKDLYDKHSILTSLKIQSNYFEAVKRRKKVEVQKEYLLLSVPTLPPNACILQENADRKQKNVNRKRHSTVEHSTEEESNISYTELENSNTAPPFISLTLNNKTEYLIYTEDIKTYSELYPAVDVEQQFREMKAWTIANPSKRKTKGGIKRFINNWLSKEQDKGYRSHTPANASNTTPYKRNLETEEELERRAREMNMEV